MNAPGAALGEGELLTTAEMARLALSEEESAGLRDAIGQMLSYFDQMNAVDVSGVAPTTHAPVADGNGEGHSGTAPPPLRPDTARPSASRWARATEQELVARAGESEDGFVTTPNVL